MKEIWKDIIGYEGLYRISDQGRIFSVKSGKIRETFVSNSGYKMIHLYKNGTDRHFTVHRLVADNFIPNPFDFKEINHINEDKSNNRHDNLEWCTQKYNENYGTNTRRVKESYIANCNNRPIDVYDMNGVFLKTFDCSNDVCRELNIGRRALYSVCQGVVKSSKGYRFAFHGEELKPYDQKNKKRHVSVFKYDSEGYLSACYDSMRDAERENNLHRGFLRMNNIRHNGNIVKDGYRYIIV